MPTPANNSSIEYRNWDSEFFGFRIGKTHSAITNKGDLEHLELQAQNENFSLIYIFSDALINLEHSKLKLVDTKCTFSKINLSQSRANTDIAITHVTEGINNEDKDKLYDLAIIAGMYSRFKIDPSFGEGAFKKLYHTWVDNSLTGTLADKVFIARGCNQRIEGFITAKLVNQTCKIGLVAVDNHSQGKGIGKYLLNKTVNYALKNHAHEIQVDTQLDNLIACNFYKNNNFALKEKKYIYHLWL